MRFNGPTVKLLLDRNENNKSKFWKFDWSYLKSWRADNNPLCLLVLC